MISRQGGLTRREAAFANDIRGCAPAKGFGVNIYKSFGLEDRWIDLSSGDLPKAMDGRRFASIDIARERGGSVHVAYDNPLYAEAQVAVKSYVTGMSDTQLGLKSRNDRGRFQVVSGISSFMPDALTIAAEALGYPSENWHQDGERPMVIVVPPLHPHWIASIVEKWGYSAITTIKRTKDGRIDRDHMREVFEKIDRKFIVISTPDENPSGICTPNSDLINSDQDGLYDHIRNTSHFGVLLLDNIYMDLAWGDNALKRYDLLQQINERGIRCIAMHSLSKAFMKPGLRIGGVAYVGPADDIGEGIVYQLEITARGKINNGISGGQLAALIEAYSGSDAVMAELSSTRDEIQARVLQNWSAMNTRTIVPAFDDVILEAAFYGLHRLVEPAGVLVPWRSSEYRQWLVDLLERKLDLTPSQDRVLWNAFRKGVGRHGWSPSNAFVLEMALNGVQMLPSDPFSPLFSDDTMRDFNPHLFSTDVGKQAIVFRTVLAYSPDSTTRARDTIESVWNQRIEDFSRGRKHWSLAYK
jgi:aspartate/methionine/tyrosine aminotransferase